MHSVSLVKRQKILSQDVQNYSYDFDCNLCKNIVENPVQCSQCNYFYCKLCLLQKSQSLQCLQCQSSTQPLSKKQESTFKNYQVKCNDCQRKFKLQIFENHSQLCKSKLLPGQQVQNHDILFDPMRYSNYSNQFECYVCYQISKEPKQCQTCKKIFCSKCIDECLQKFNECPNRCNKKIEICKLQQNLQQEYLSQQVICIYCFETYPFREIKIHEQECQFPKCQNFDICQKRLSGDQNSPLYKQGFCELECLLMISIMNSSSNQQYMYKTINNFMNKYYPSIDPQPNAQAILKQNSIDLNNQLTIQQSILANNLSLQNEQFVLQWDPKFTGTGIQITNNNQLFLNEQQYVFKTSLCKQSFNQGIHYWEITMDSRTENELKIGVAVNNKFSLNTAFCDTQAGYAYYGLGSLRHGDNSNGKQYGKQFKKEGVLGVLLNMEKGQLSFALNQNYYGVAFEAEALKKGPIWPAVALLHIAGCKIQYQKQIPKYFPESNQK